MNAAIEYLQAQPFVRQHGFGVTGFCMGGRITYLMSAMRPDVIRAGVVWYGGHIMVAKADGDMLSPFDQSSAVAAPLLGPLFLLLLLLLTCGDSSNVLLTQLSRQPPPPHASNWRTRNPFTFP